MSFDYKQILLLIVSLANTFLGIVVLARDVRSKTNQAFSLFAFAIAFWSMCIFGFYGFTVALLQEYAIKISHVAAIVIGGSFLQFADNFPAGVGKRVTLSRKLLFFWGLILSALILVPGFLTKGEVVYINGALGVPMVAPHHLWFSLFFIATFFGGVVNIYKKLRTSEDLQLRLQLKFVFYSVLFAGSGGVFLNLVLPSPYINNWSFISIGPLCTFLIVLMVFYAIIKHRFLDIRIIATEVATIFIALLLFVDMLFVETFWPKVVRVLVIGFILVVGFYLSKSLGEEVKKAHEITILNRKLENSLKDIETTNEKLKLLDKAKDEFLSIASHQLRTPLTAIKGYVSMIVDGDYGKIPDSVKEKLQNVFTANERLVKLVDDLLSISRIEAGRMQLNPVPVQLNDIITEVVGELQFKSKEKNIPVEFTPASDLALVMADKDKVFEVVMNLVDNAIKYSEKGSVRVSAVRQHGMVMCAVKDDGMGMTDETIGQLFQKFSRGGMRNVVGNGLGLYIGRLIIEAHGGRIWVESQGLGKGSQFYFVLPVAPGQPEAQQK